MGLEHVARLVLEKIHEFILIVGKASSQRSVVRRCAASMCWVYRVDLVGAVSSPRRSRGPTRRSPWLSCPG
jgi:hypothetical protein